MSDILEGHEGVLCHIDDVIIFGRNKQEHDEQLQIAPKSIQAAGVTISSEKCKFNKERLLFLSHIIDKNGISPDPVKTSAVAQMERPQSITELTKTYGYGQPAG